MFNKPILIINSCCLLACLIQIILVGYGQIFPARTVNNLEHKNLSKMEFPVVFKLCFRNVSSENERRFRSVGYEDLRGYFEGQSAFNNSLIGWAGHTKDGDVVGTPESK